VGDDIPNTEGIAQEGASEKMPLSLTIIAMTVTASASTPLILRYVATSFTVSIGVVDLFVFWFTSFVDGIILTHFSCHGVGLL
jgi:hypothetical protein